MSGHVMARWMALGALAVGACGGTPAPASTEPAPARPVIFIPGFGGSELVASAGGQVTVTLESGSTRTISISPNEVVWPHFNSHTGDVWTPLFDADYYRVLRIGPETEALRITSNGKLMTDMGGYGEVEPFFTTNGYATGATFFIFGWDWRKSVVEAAGQLDALITTALQRSGRQQVDIVAHSAGTLVLRAYLLDTHNANRTNVAHAAFLGGPGLGAPEADDVLLVGHCAHMVLFKCVIPPETQRYVFKTSPGALQMATGASYYDRFAESDASHPVAYTTAALDATVPPGERGYTWFSENVLRPATGQTTVDPDALRATDNSWLGAVSASTSIALGGGSGKCALGQLRNSNAGVARIGIDGDTVVPRQSAIFGEDLTAGYQTSSTQAPTAARPFIFVRPLEHGELAGKAGLPVTLAWLRGQTVEAGAIQPTTCPVTTP